jgi:FtsP/CotA-like multicopper oxidase with cupredoxin domain
MIGIAPIACMSTSAAAITHANQAEQLAMQEASFIPDRELRLMVSDNMQRQSWLYAGQHYTEEGNVIVLNENEQLRLILTNDTDRAQSLAFEGARIDLAAREARTLDLVIDQLQNKSLSNPAAGVSRMLKVRPSYQTHAPFAA